MLQHTLEEGSISQTSCDVRLTYWLVQRDSPSLETCRRHSSGQSETVKRQVKRVDTEQERTAAGGGADHLHGKSR